LLTVATASAVAAAAYMAKPRLRKLILPELDTSYPLGVLQNAEMRTITALGEVVVALEYMPPVDFFHDYVNMVTQSRHGYLKEYQRAVTLLNTTVARLYRQGEAQQFSDLSLPRRDNVLQTLLWQYSATNSILPKVEKLGSSLDALALRIYILGPLIDHYYRSSYGWEVVGYKSFPGRPPLDAKAYTKPASG
jgi:hypothetical protein